MTRQGATTAHLDRLAGDANGYAAHGGRLSPVDFAQRFVGTFSDDGATIDGRWETSPDGGEHWEVDFPGRLTRAAAPSP